MAAFACALASAQAHAGEAEEAYRNGEVYDELYRISLLQWERVFQLSIPADASLPKEGAVGPAPELLYYAGLCAFYRGEYSNAENRMRSAAKLAELRKASPFILSDAATWASISGVAAKPPLDLQELQRAGARDSQSLTTVLFALDFLRRAEDAQVTQLWRDLYERLKTQAPEGNESPLVARRRAWLRFRAEGEVTAYLEEKTSALPDFTIFGPNPKMEKSSEEAERRGGGIELWDVARLRELAQVQFARARTLSRSDEQVHVRALMRLGEFSSARKAAREAAARNIARGDAEARLRHYTWRILKEQANQLAGEKDSLLTLAERLANPGFAEQEKEIYFRIAQALAEALIEVGAHKQALHVAQSAVDSLEANYKARWPSSRLIEYYEQTRPIYATLAHACYLNDQHRKSFDVYGLVYPWHRQAWLSTLRSDPLFCVRYAALLCARNDFALARELVFNYQPYGLIAEFPAAAQLHSVGSTLEYLLRPRGRTETTQTG